jgi:hypothetical protein
MENWYNTAMKNLRQLLNSGKTVFVRFEKADGSIRHMICTQNPQMIPKDHRPSGIPMQYDKAQIRVWDVVAKEWRSMREERVQECSEYTAQVA